jgi:hypothetical protein
MEQETPGGTPPVAVTTPVAAQPATSSSTVQDDFKQKAQSVQSRADLTRAIEEMKRQPKPTAQKPVTETPAVEATPVAEPVATPAETSEATPEPAVEPEQPEQPAAATEPDATTEEETDGGEGPVTPLTGKRAHIRVNEADEIGKLALAYQKRNRDWTLEQALDAAKKQMGIAPQKQEATAEPKGPQMPKTVQDVDAALEQKLTEYEKALADVNFEQAGKINREILKLTVHRSTIERSAEREQQTAETKFNADFDASEAKAVEFYPFYADTNSPAAKRMKEIEATLKATDDPLYFSPNKPLKLAQMVAAELNIAPKSKTATPAKPAAAPAPTPAPKKGVVPSGSNRTVPPAPKPAVDPEISGIKTPGDFRKQMRKLGVPGY